MPTVVATSNVLQVVALLAVCCVAWLWRRVAREERVLESTATDELWARGIAYYMKNRRPGALRAPRTGGSTNTRGES